MKKLTGVTSASAAPYTKHLVFLRIALGILLCIKGNDFIHDTIPLQELLAQQQSLAMLLNWSLFAAAWALLCGGILIILGFFTRMACIILLPIVTVVLLVQFSNYTLSDYTLLEIIAAFCGLTLFLEKGGGRISLDRLLRRNQSEHIVFWA
jgi:putative oxidoreductase